MYFKFGTMQKSLLFKGESITYELRGTGLPVLLLHGFMEDRRIWDEVLSGIENKYLWILPDLPGSGQSAFNPGLKDLTDFAECIPAILEQEKINKTVLIGHSMGGYISLAFAKKYPDKIRALGLFHSSSYADAEERKQAREKNIRFIEKNGSRLFLAQAIPGLFSENYKSANPASIEKLVDRSANFLPESLVQYLEAMKRRPPTTEVLISITNPVLFIMGEEDKAVSLKDGLEQSHLPGISYIHILTHSAHMGMIEESNLCNTILDRFLEHIPV
jgi:pimeloyl-ACP methyl ester carboxylesterase